MQDHGLNIVTLKSMRNQFRYRRVCYICIHIHILGDGGPLFIIYRNMPHQNIIRSEKGIKEGKTLRIFVVYIYCGNVLFFHNLTLYNVTHTLLLELELASRVNSFIPLRTHILGHLIASLNEHWETTIIDKVKLWANLIWRSSSNAQLIPKWNQN